MSKLSERHRQNDKYTSRGTYTHEILVLKLAKRNRISLYIKSIKSHVNMLSTLALL